MKLVATIALAAILFVAILAYCLRRGRISERPGVLYILVAAIACEAVLVSILAAQSATQVRDLLTDDYAGIGPLTGHAGGDPSGSGFVAAQVAAFPQPAVSDEAAWRSWQRRLRSHLKNEVYELDLEGPRPNAPGQFLQRTGSDTGLLRKEFAIPAADGDLIPAVMLAPADAGSPLPGILVIPGHVKDGRSGLAQMVLPVRSYQQSAARELALAGFATLTVELRGFGMRGPPDFANHLIVAYNAILGGGFYKKLAVDDIRRALDLFEQLPEVDAARLGIAGVSLGGELAVEYAALDERIKAISFHSHGGRTGPFAGRDAPNAAQPHYCHVIPGANSIMRKEDPFLLLAPRPTQGLRGGHEPFPDDGLFAGELQAVWTILGATADLQIETIPNQGHLFFVEPAKRFFKEHL